MLTNCSTLEFCFDQPNKVERECELEKHYMLLHLGGQRLIVPATFEMALKQLTMNIVQCKSQKISFQLL